jgi:hypothetical protein
MRHIGHLTEQGYLADGSDSCRTLRVPIVSYSFLVGRRRARRFYHHCRDEGEICTTLPVTWGSIECSGMWPEHRHYSNNRFLKEDYNA